jgi:integrase
MDDSEMRLFVALARWGGLRCPSEPTRLKWSDIDVARGRISVDSTKTGRRELPLFPELAPFIQQRFDDAEPGDEYVLPMTHRLCRQAFATKVSARLRLMGEDRWTRIFHSMRSTRQTELVERFPSHVVAAWLGNSVETANKHYLQTTEAHFAEALKAAQIPAQTASATPRQASPTG